MKYFLFLMAVVASATAYSNPLWTWAESTGGESCLVNVSAPGGAITTWTGRCNDRHLATGYGTITVMAPKWVVTIYSELKDGSPGGSIGRVTVGYWMSSSDLIHCEADLDEEWLSITMQCDTEGV